MPSRRKKSSSSSSSTSSSSSSSSSSHSSSSSSSQSSTLSSAAVAVKKKRISGSFVNNNHNKNEEDADTLSSSQSSKLGPTLHQLYLTVGAPSPSDRKDKTDPKREEKRPFVPLLALGMLLSALASRVVSLLRALSFGLLSHHIGGGGGDWWRGAHLWSVLTVSAVYGAVSYFRACGYDVGCVNARYGAFTSVLAARLTGKAATGYFAVTLLFCTRSLTSRINELPPFRRAIVGLDWRKAHIGAALMGTLCATVHSVAHLIRIFAVDSPPAEYSSGRKSAVREYYSAITGTLLAIVCAVQIVTYGLIALSVRLRSRGGGGNWAQREQSLKVFFRRTHVPLYYAFVALFTIHAYEHVILMLAVLLTIDRRMSRVALRSFRWWIDEESKVCVIRAVTSEPEIVRNFGYYYQVQVDGVSASFTMIPSNEPDGSPSLGFRIRHPCSVSLALQGLQGRSSLVRTVPVASAMPAHGIGHRNSELHSAHSGILHSTVSEIDPAVLVANNGSRAPVALFGPFQSNDFSTRNAGDKLILTSGIGGTVSESILRSGLMSLGATNVVIHAEGRRVPSEGLMAWPPVDQRCAWVPPPPPVVVNGELRAQGSIDTTLREAAGVSRIGPDEAVYIHLAGELDVVETCHLLAAFAAEGFDIISCGIMWNQLLERIEGSHDPGVAELFNAIRGRIHAEEFGI